MPEFVAFFGGRDGAGATLLAVMLAAIDGTPVPSRAELAGAFGLPKTQVTHVLIAGQAQGYFVPDDAGVPAATRHLRDSFSRWVSLELAFYVHHMHPPAVSPRISCDALAGVGAGDVGELAFESRGE
jgi:hypothetical protein